MRIRQAPTESDEQVRQRRLSAMWKMRVIALIMLGFAITDAHRGLVLLAATLTSAGVCAIASLELADEAGERQPVWLRFATYVVAAGSAIALVIGLVRAVIR